MLGYSSEEVLAGQPSFLEDRIHPDDRPIMRAAIERTRRTGEPFHAEYRIQAHGGQWIWVQDEASLVRDEQGRPLLWQGVLVDATPRRRAEVAEVLYSTLFEHSLDAVLLTAADGRILDPNPEACRLFGWTVDELRQVARAGVVDPEDPRLIAALAERERTGRFRGELTLRRRDGEIFPAEVATQVFPEPDGQTWTSMTIRDLTSQRQAEAARRASEERFRALVQNSYGAIVVLDAAGNRTYVSPSIERLLGYRPEDLLGRPPGELIHPDDAPKLQAAIQGCLRGAKQIPAFELRVRHCDGGWRDFETVATNLLDEPSVAGIVFNSRDITLRKAAQAALRESQERFQSAFDHAPIGMALIAPDGQFLQVNRALCELVGYAEGELVGNTFQAITHPDDLADDLELANRLWAGEIETYQLEKRYIHKDGHEVWALMTRSAVRDGDVPRYGITQILDIAERRQIEAERTELLDRERLYAQQLRELAEMRADLTAMIAHELRQPLSALSILTHLLEAGGLSPEQEAEDFATVRSELAHLERLVTDVATAAAAERESFSVDPRSTRLRELLDAATTFAEVALAGHPFTVTPAPDVLVRCDAARIGQILRNLLQNCATHTPAGTPVELRARQGGSRVHFEVADRGPGLAPDELRRIFEKFGRGRAASRRQAPGSGLGLYLARRIALAHGTDLEVMSTPGKGTTFTFSLPVVP